jgi:hypothetical protein
VRHIGQNTAQTTAQPAKRDRPGDNPVMADDNAADDNAADDNALAAWLAGPVAAAYDAIAANPRYALSAAQLRARLARLRRETVAVAPAAAASYRS